MLDEQNQRFLIGELNDYLQLSRSEWPQNVLSGSRCGTSEEVADLMAFLVSPAMVTTTLSSSASADNYSALAAQGYRWIIGDGPCACHSEPDSEKVRRRHADATGPNVVQNIWCYYVLPGKIVQVIKEDRSCGMSQMRVADVPRPLWTDSRFLSRRPIRDPYGVIEMPENSGLISTGPGGGMSPLPSGSPTPRTR
jgi:hypothetical protein